MDFFTKHSGSTPGSANWLDALRIKFTTIACGAFGVVYNLATDPNGSTAMSAVLSEWVGSAAIAGLVISTIIIVFRDNRHPDVKAAEKDGTVPPAVTPPPVGDQS